MLSSFFAVARSATVPVTEFPTTPGTPADVQSFHSAPELHPPAVTVHQPAGPGSAPGYVFAAPFIGPGQYGPMIFDNAGNLVWFRQVPAGQDAAGFRTQTFHGENDLTWWQGRTLQFGYGLGENVIANANYKTVAVVRAGNGLQADEHEFLVTPQGSAFLLAYSPVHTDLSSAGGPGSGVALDGVIQQIDIHTGLVMWEWHSLGHVALTESYSKPPATTAVNGVYDYFHINSLTLDSHGNLLISARNTWALYDISAANGQVMWRLGGKKSTFALAPGVPFAYQHNALWLPGGADQPVRRRGSADGQRALARRGREARPEEQDGHALEPARAHARPADHRQPGQRAVAAGRRLDDRLGRPAKPHRIQRAGPGHLRRSAAPGRVQLPHLPRAVDRSAEHAAEHRGAPGRRCAHRLCELERRDDGVLLAAAQRLEREPADAR